MSKKIKILLGWFPKDGIIPHLQKNIGQNEKVEWLHAPEKDLVKDYVNEHIQDADIFLGWRINEEQINSAEKLKLMVNPGTGVQQYTEEVFEAIKSKNITLTNGHSHAKFSAQHAIAMMFSLTNAIIPHHKAMLNGQWRTRNELATSMEIGQKKVGLLGYGAINKIVHDYLSGFPLQFAALKKRPWAAQTPGLMQYNLGDLEEFLKWTDILFIAIPQTNETIDLLAAHELSLLGSDCIVINVARGSIINEQALYDALKENRIYAAGLDVWYNYNPEELDGKKYPYSFPFYELENVVLSPHRAGIVKDDIERWDDVIAIINAQLDGKKLKNIVDLNLQY